MVTEGLLTSKHAEELLDEVRADAQNIEKQRNAMFRDHAKRKVCLSL